MKKSILWFLFFITALSGNAQEAGAEIRGTVSWERMEITAAVTLDLPSAGIRIPVGRSRAEELVRAEYPRLIRSCLLSLPVDSSGTLEDKINQGELPLSAVNALIRSSRQVPPALSADLVSMTSQYTLDMYTVGASLLRHRRPAEISRTLTPRPAAAYTGIIIIADGDLPVQGRNRVAPLLPCLFPKIWDTENNLIYERNVVEPGIGKIRGIVRYVSETALFHPTPSGLEGELLEWAGPNPLRIIARGVFGIRPTDPIIDREDALLIISSEANRRLLREGKVILVVRPEVLTAPFGTPSP
ncbi:MAG: polymerase [Spirochaetaceae bacterium]|jgi:hypothetical protein|nr:polymerase [Spirochaetaceae bacterium]